MRLNIKIVSISGIHLSGFTDHNKLSKHLQGIKFEEVKTNSTNETCIPFLATHLALVDETWQFHRFGVQQQTL
jgi:hypothetical protein